MRSESRRDVTVTLYGTGLPVEWKSFKQDLDRCRGWLNLPALRRGEPEDEGRVFRRFQLKLRQKDVPRLRAVLDFHGCLWQPPSHLDAYRMVGEDLDVGRATRDEERAVERAQEQDRLAEQKQLSCRVRT